jgi:type VI secretion system protein VasD
MINPARVKRDLQQCWTSRCAQPLAALCIILLLSGCKGKPLPIPFVSKPTRIAIEIKTAGNINPATDGRASPLVLRVYQLKSPAVFNKVDFFALYDADERTLGGDLVHKEDVIMKPNETQTLVFEPPDGTQAIGIFAAFRDYERAQWRAVAAIQPHKSNVVQLNVSGTSLTIR